MSGRVSIVIPDDFPPAYQGQPEIDRLKQLADLRLYGERAADREELLQRLRGADIVLNVRAYTHFNEELLRALPELRMIAVFGTGTDNIDLDAAAALGIAVTNAPGANARSVAEHTIALMLAVARAIPQHDRFARRGEWRHIDGIELEGKTIGVIGLGNIGRQVAMMAGALGMRVIGWSRTQDADRAARAGTTLVDFDDLFSNSDVVSLNIALSESTRGLIGVRELGLMRAGAILLNTARGGLVDEAALVAALRQRRIRGAGIDVFSIEPIAADNPFAGLDNVVLTPHSGWVTEEARTRLLAMPVHNIEQFIAGHPVNVVNPAALERLRPIP